MARDIRQWKRDARNREKAELRETFEMFRRTGPAIKDWCRKNGINLPFYEFYDSYYDEFQHIARQAMQSYPSLIAVTEVDDLAYFSQDRSAFSGGLTQIFWESEGVADGYAEQDRNVNINGLANGFKTADGALKTLVLIRRDVPGTKPHREFKYVLKVIALLHELGHIEDMEKEVNFDHKAKRFNMIEAEVYAHLYSLRRMAEWNYYHAYQMVVTGLREYAKGTTYLRDVSRITLDRLPAFHIVNLQEAIIEKRRGQTT